MFTVASFTVAKKWKHPNIHELVVINTLWLFHKTGQMLTFTATQKNPANIRPSERRQE